MQSANITYDYLKHSDLGRSFIIGYYGGGNYGDELLLEIIVNLINPKYLNGITAYYKNSQLFHHYHGSQPYKLAKDNSLRQLFYSIVSCRRIIIGGGGHWGVDSNKSTLILGMLLFFSKFLLRKQVILLGVGYYESTNLFGKLSARLTYISANKIIVRDEESFENFIKIDKRLGKKVQIDFDIASLIDKVDLSKYKYDAGKLHGLIKDDNNKFFTIITQRRVSGSIKSYQNIVESFIKSNPSNNVLLLTLEHENIDNQGYEFFKHLAKLYDNVIHIPFIFNPIAYYVFFKNLIGRAVVITPQYHCQLIAAMAGIPILPVIYDNKNLQLINQLRLVPGPRISNISMNDIEIFINNYRQEII